MDNYYISAASQLFMAGQGHLLIVTNKRLLHKCSISAVHDRSVSTCAGRTYAHAYTLPLIIAYI